MACRSCAPTSVYNFNTTGMTGLVCGISAPPAIKDISSCCPTGHWMVKSNCTQYCEAHDQAQFSLCINGDRSTAGNNSSFSPSNSYSAPVFYNTLCKNASASGNETGTAGANASVVSGAVESTSQANRSTAWGYSTMFLALSTIAFSMTPY